MRGVYTNYAGCMNAFHAPHATCGASVGASINGATSAYVRLSLRCTTWSNAFYSAGKCAF